MPARRIVSLPAISGYTVTQCLTRKGARSGGGSWPPGVREPKAREPCGDGRPHRRPGLQPPVDAGLVVVEPDEAEHVRPLAYPADQVLRGCDRVRAGLHRG